MIMWGVKNIVFLNVYFIILYVHPILGVLDHIVELGDVALPLVGIMLRQGSYLVLPKGGALKDLRKEPNAMTGDV